MDRNIVSDGNKKALDYIQKNYKNLKIHRFESGSRFYDWEVPNSWKLNKAEIKNSKGEKILSNLDSPFSVVFCSESVEATIKGIDLLERIHTTDFYLKLYLIDKVHTKINGDFVLLNLSKNLYLKKKIILFR